MSAKWAVCERELGWQLSAVLSIVRGVATTTMMTRRRLASRMLALGVLFCVATAGQASAEDNKSAPADVGIASCDWRDWTSIDSGVSRATGDLYYCSGNGLWYVEGVLSDTACDNRTAYLDGHGEGQGDHSTSVSGCGNSRSYTFYWDSPLYGVKLRTRACNTTCSNGASDWLYP